MIIDPKQLVKIQAPKQIENSLDYLLSKLDGYCITVEAFWQLLDIANEHFGNQETRH
jgi:hypothetical protein